MSESELARDISMSYPEAVWDLDSLERYRRCRLHSELAALDENRFFIRAVLCMPIEDETEFTWGVWCEVSREDHDRYLKALRYGTLSRLGVLQGRLANELPVYEHSLGLRVTLKPSDESRPTVKVQEESALKAEQAAGISLKRLEEINRLLFEDDEEEPEEA